MKYHGEPPYNRGRVSLYFLMGIFASPWGQERMIDAEKSSPGDMKRNPGAGGNGHPLAEATSAEKSTERKSPGPGGPGLFISD